MGKTARRSARKLIPGKGLFSLHGSNFVNPLSKVSLRKKWSSASYGSWVPFCSLTYCTEFSLVLIEITTCRLIVEWYIDGEIDVGENKLTNRYTRRHTFSNSTWSNFTYMFYTFQNQQTNLIKLLHGDKIIRLHHFVNETDSLWQTSLYINITHKAKHWANYHLSEQHNYGTDIWFSDKE